MPATEREHAVAADLPPRTAVRTAVRAGLARGRTPGWVLVLSALLAAVLLYFALRGVSWPALWGALRRGNPGYLALSFVTLSAAYVAMGLRWGVLVSGERRLTPTTAFWTTMIGLFGNGFLPARAGDVIRIVVTSRVAAASAGAVLAAVIAERLSDVLALATLGMLASLTLRTLPSWLRDATRLAAFIAIVGMVALVLASYAERATLSLLARAPLPEAVRSRAMGLLRKFLVGTRVLQRPRNAVCVAALTAMVWSLNIATTLEMARALHLALTWQQAMLFQIALGLASAAPSTPGYVGIFQFVAVTVLVPFGLTRDDAVALVIVLQAVTYIAVTLWGMLGVWRIAARDGSAAEQRGRAADPDSMLGSR